MYSKNDYRYYLEKRIRDDYIAHERSHKYIKKIGDRYFYTTEELTAYMNGVARTMGRDQERGRKRTAQERIRVDQNRGKNRTAQLKGSPEYKQELSYNSKKNDFPKPNSSKTNKTTKKTTKKTKNAKKVIDLIRKKYGLYRTTPKGKKLKGGGNIYVSHS